MRHRCLQNWARLGLRTDNTKPGQTGSSTFRQLRLLLRVDHPLLKIIEVAEEFVLQFIGGGSQYFQYSFLNVAISYLALPEFKRIANSIGLFASKAEKEVLLESVRKI